MDLQEEDRAGDDAQVAWEEEGAVLTEHCDEEGGGQRGGEACLGLQGSCAWLVRPFSPTPYQPHPRSRP